MATYSLFSKRQKKLRGEFPDVYQYEEIPQEFRVQIIHIIQDTIGIGRYEIYSCNSFDIWHC